MKLSFSTLGCPDWSWTEILDNAQSMGYDGIEIRGIEGEMNIPSIPQFFEENISETINELKKRGLCISALDSSAMFHDADNHPKAIEEMKRTMDVAKKLGVKYVRYFGNNIPDLTKTDETLDIIARGMGEIHKYSEGKDVTPVFEVHGEFDNAAVFEKLLKKFSHPKFSVLWDIEHTHKVYGDNFRQFLDFIGKYVRHIHVKDIKKAENGWELTRIGHGEIPIGKIAAALDGIGFDGYFSLEWEKKWHPELEAPEIVFPEYVKYMRNCE